MLGSWIGWIECTTCGGGCLAILVRIRAVILGSHVWLLLLLVTACSGGAPNREAEARQLGTAGE